MFDTRQVIQYSIPNLYLVIAAIAAVFTGLGFRRMVKRMTRNAGKVRITAAAVAAVVGISAASCSIYLAVQSMVWLAHGSHVIALRPAQSTLAIKDLYGKSIFEILNAIPLLKIPDTIGWEDPIPRPAMLGGIVLVLLKLLLLVGFARLFSQMWQAARAREAQQSSPSHPDSGPGAERRRPPRTAPAAPP